MQWVALVLLGRVALCKKGLAFISITRVTPCMLGCAEGEISPFSTRAEGMARHRIHSKAETSAPNLCNHLKV